MKQRTICPGVKFTWWGMGGPSPDVSLSVQLSACGACFSVQASVSTFRPVDVFVCYSLTRSLILTIIFLCVLEFIHRPLSHGCAYVYVLLIRRSLYVNVCVCAHASRACVRARTHTHTHMHISVVLILNVTIYFSIFTFSHSVFFSIIYVFLCVSLSKHLFLC